MAFANDAGLAKHIARYLNGEAPHAGFNAAAAWLVWLWFAGRKLYLYAVITFVAELGWIFAALAGFKTNAISLSQGAFVASACGLLVTSHLAVGLLANILLARKARSIVAEVAQSKLSPAAHLSEIARRGGRDENLINRITLLLARMVVSIMTGGKR